MTKSPIIRTENLSAITLKEQTFDHTSPWANSELVADININNNLQPPPENYTSMGVSERIALIDTITNHMFRKGSIMKYDSMKETLDKIAAYYGFDISKGGERYFACSRQGLPRHNKNRASPSRQRCSSQSNKCNCGYAIYFSWFQGKKESGFVKITTVKGEHNESCCPGNLQVLMAVKRRNRSYAEIRKDVLTELMRLMDTGFVIPTNIFRELLKPCFPDSFHLSSNYLCNIKIRIKGLRAERIEKGEYKIRNVENIFEGIESFSNTDESIKYADEILYETLKNSTEGWMVVSYLQKLNEKDSMFTYRIAYDEDGVPTGFVWQTGTMRRSFELYGEILSLDAMKRTMNDLNWPYMAPVVLDGDKRIFVACEGFVCGELKDAYGFVLESLFEMSPGRGKDEVFVVYSDGFLSSDLIEHVGMTNAKHVLDLYHLRKVDWPNAFGQAIHSKIEKYLDGMAFANNETDFTKSYEEAKKHLSGTRLEYLEKYGKRPESYSLYKVRSYPGNLGRQGSTHSEQNHSSVVSRIGPSLLVEPHETVQLFMRRQGDLLKKTNDLLTNYFMAATGKTSAMSEDDPRKVPMSKLSSWGYSLWLDNYRKSKHIANVNLASGRCECVTRISYFCQCEHELFARSFDISEWSVRWHQRQLLEPSNNIHSSVITSSSLQPESVNVDVEPNDNVERKLASFENPGVQLKDTITTRKKTKYSSQQGYARLVKAFNNIASLASKNETTCNTMIGFAQEIETFLVTGQTIEENTIKAWLQKVRLCGSKRKFTLVSVNTGVAQAIPVSQRLDVGRPNTKRLKSSQEMKTKRKQKSCRFCLQHGHTVSSCPLARIYGRLITTKDLLSELIVSLRYHVNSRQRSKPSEKVKMIIPGGVAFIALLDYEEEGIRGSCLKTGGTPMNGWTEQVFNVDTVIEWVIKYGTGHVFSKLVSHNAPTLLVTQDESTLITSSASKVISVDDADYSNDGDMDVLLK